MDELLGIVWAAYDTLLKEFFSHIDDWNEDFEDLEREITEEFADAIHDQLRARGGLLPVGFRHGPYERETRSPAPAQPREYDLGFVFNADKRMLWPLEAKVLRSDANTDRNLKDYVETVQTRYLTCTYAPFINCGVMLGYLKGGNADTVLEHLAARLDVKMRPYAPFPERTHRTSDHVRMVPNGKPYPTEFRCHHLILPLRAPLQSI